MDICVLRLLIFARDHPDIWKAFSSLRNSKRHDIYRAYSHCTEELTGENGSFLTLSLAFTKGDSELVLLAFHLLSTFWENSSEIDTP